MILLPVKLLEVPHICLAIMVTDSIIFTKFMHVIACASIPSLLKADSYIAFHMCVCVYYILFLHLQTCWCSYVLLIVNNAAMNIDIQISPQRSQFQFFFECAYSEKNCGFRKMFLVTFIMTYQIIKQIIKQHSFSLFRKERFWVEEALLEAF